MGALYLTAVLDFYPLLHEIQQYVYGAIVTPFFCRRFFSVRLLSRSLHRVLAWVGWGLNRIALGRENVQSDMLYVDNLVRLFA